MSHKKKRNIIIGTLCGIVLLMIAGYAAFNSILDIKGTSSINSSWNIKITKVEKTASKGATDVEGTPKFDNLSATFNTNLESPGDYATYKIEITNNGNLDAVLKNIDMPENTNKDIAFYLNKEPGGRPIEGALDQNSQLFRQGQTGNIGYVYLTVLYKSYAGQQTPTNDNDKTVSMKITFDFEQATGTIHPVPDQVVYSKNALGYDIQTDTSNYIYPGDTLEKITGYTEDPSTLGDFYLKHNMINGKVESNELCFIKDGQTHCFHSNEYPGGYSTNLMELYNIFGTKECQNGAGTSVTCNNENLSYIINYGTNSYLSAVGRGGAGSTQCILADTKEAYCMLG